MKVVAAILIYNKKVLAFRRPYIRNDSLISLKYEFPGGKVKKNENEITALKRELQEELSLNIGNFKKFYFTSHDYIKYSVDISFYLNELKHINFKLNFHNEYKIICIEDLKELDWLQADYSVIDYIQKNGLRNNLI
jgi:8-oxo-dGTP diphosphatase